MATKQKVKVSVEKLLERVRQVAEENEATYKQKLAVWKQEAEVFRAEKLEELKKSIEEYKKMSAEQLTEHNYKLRKPVGPADDQRVIHLLEMSSDEVITIDSESDFGRYL